MMHPFSTNDLQLSLFPNPLKIRVGDQFTDTNNVLYVVVEILQNSNDGLDDIVIYKKFEPNYDTRKETVVKLNSNLDFS